jgi:hypothetical protein
MVGGQHLISGSELGLADDRLGSCGRVVNEDQAVFGRGQKRGDSGAHPGQQARQLPNQEVCRVAFQGSPPPLLILKHARRRRAEPPVVEVGDAWLERPGPGLRTYDHQALELATTWTFQVRPLQEVETNTWRPALVSRTV